MRVLVACEESQVVCCAFRERGHEAYSCDLQECSGGHPEWHIQADALELLKMRWDLIIAHPPCTYLTASSAVRLYNKDHTLKDAIRFEKGKQAARFFMAFYDADCMRIAIENPVPIKAFGLPQYSQIIEPFMFGDPWRKRTCLWVKGLPPLIMKEAPVEPTGLWVGSTCKRRQKKDMEEKGYYLNTKRDPKIRAKTFPGIAKAMAEQWG